MTRSVEAFYFTSYGRTIGIARNVRELSAEIARLAKENPAAVTYHLKQGHIVWWLECADEKELAKQLKGVESINEARLKLNKSLEEREPKTRSHAFHQAMPRDSYFNQG